MVTTRRRVRGELKNPAYEIFIGVLSVLSIVNLVLVYVFMADAAMQLVLGATNALFSVIFLLDFIYRITTAEAPWAYFLKGFGWADLLASLPFPQFKILRIFRLLRVIRLLRALGVRRIVSILVHDRANSTLMTLLLLGILVLQFGSISILAVEEHADGSNITTASDALWYTIVTIATVGYGDQYPMIIVVGIGIFGTFTGYLANAFLGPSKKTGAEADRSSISRGDDDADGSERSSKATAAGVAAGAASGAVTTGMTAKDVADAGEPTDTRAPASNEAASLDAAADEIASARADRLHALIAQVEAMQAELRELLAENGGHDAETR